MNSIEENSDNTRRDFLKIGTLGALAACGSAVCSCKSDPNPIVIEPGKKVKLLSPDGEMVEVDESELRHIHKTIGVSREEARQGIPGKKLHKKMF